MPRNHDSARTQPKDAPVSARPDTVLPTSTNFSDAPASPRCVSSSYLPMIDKFYSRQRPQRAEESVLVGNQSVPKDMDNGCVKMGLSVSDSSQWYVPCCTDALHCDDTFFVYCSLRSMQEASCLYVNSLVELILVQGLSFDFSVVDELLDPGALTVGVFLQMQRLRRPLFVHLFERLSPTQDATVAYNRAENLAEVARNVDKQIYTRRKLGRVDAAAAIGVLQKVWKETMAMKPAAMEANKWRTYQKSVNPMTKRRQQQRKKQRTTATMATTTAATAHVADDVLPLSRESGNGQNFFLSPSPSTSDRPTCTPASSTTTNTNVTALSQMKHRTCHTCITYNIHIYIHVYVYI
jgi:hypothetical protein